MEETTAFQRKVWDFDAMLAHGRCGEIGRAGPGLHEPGRHSCRRSPMLSRNASVSMAEGIIDSALSCRSAACKSSRDGERLGIIDFDDCGFSWFFYDFRRGRELHGARTGS